MTLQRGGQGAVADADISSQQPSRSAGSEPVAYVGEVGRHSRQALLQFDTSSIPPHATVTSASLSLWRQGPSQASTLTAHAITSPWQEQSVSWAGFASGFAPQVAASLQASGKPGPLSTSLTELVSLWVRQPSLNQGLLLQQSQGHSLLATSESPEAARRPSLQVCYFLPDSSPNTSSSPSLLVRVLDETGLPVSGAAVSSASAQLPTDGAGYVVLDNLPTGFFSARVEAVGFAPAVISLHLPPGARASHEVRLFPLGSPQPFSVSEGATLERGTLRVSIPPHSIVDTDGNPVSGTVEATLVVLDPTTAPTSALPGPLAGLPSADSSESVPLESFGMAEVSLWQEGRPLQLAPGAKATLELLLPEAASAQLSVGDSIPAWWLDTAERGLWVRDGEGIVQHSSTHPGRLSWVVEVSHFTWWNCDAPISDRSCVEVLVRYANGLPAAGVQVGATGVSYAGSSNTVFTGTNGRACVEIKRGATARVFTGLAGQATTEATVTGSTAPTVCGGGSCTPITLTITPPVCTPGDFQTCAYSGPPGTENVGLCRAARSYCNATGSAWGTCEGQVQPAEETCSNTFDEDCDGVANDDCPCGMPCYSGPSGTNGVGVCQAGTMRCSMGLHPYCTGQKLPSPETCATPGDDDCNGSLACTNPSVQAWRYGGTICEVPHHLIRGPDGQLIMAGYFTGAMDLGNGIGVTTSDRAYFIARLDSTTGAALWATKLETDYWHDYSFLTAHVDAPQVDASGNIVLSGLFRNRLTLGDRTLFSPNGFRDGFVGKVDGATGAVLWLTHFDSTAHSSLRTRQDVNSGDVLFVGGFDSELTIGGTPISRSSSSWTGFVGKLNGTTGALRWLNSLSGTGTAELFQPLVDGSGNALISGVFYSQLTLGSATLTNPSGRDEFVGKLDGATGALHWLTRLDSTADLLANAPQLAANGDIVLSGSFTGNLTLGSTTRSNPTRRLDGFVGKIEGATGAARWLAHIDDGYQNSQPVLDASGNVLLSGLFTGSITVGGTPLTSPTGSGGGYVGKLDGTSGVALWVNLVHGTSYFNLSPPVADASGNVLLSGTYSYGTLTAGGVTLTSLQGAGAFVWKLAGTSGSTSWFAPLRSMWSVNLNPPSVDAAGNVLLSGAYYGDVAIGETPLADPVSFGSYVGKLQGGSGALVWGRTLPNIGLNPYTPFHPPMAVPDGSSFIMGVFEGSLSLGSPPLTSAGCDDIFLARLPSDA